MKVTFQTVWLEIATQDSPGHLIFVVIHGVPKRVKVLTVEYFLTQDVQIEKLIFSETLLV